MKAYLSSATNLIRGHASTFPAFRGATSSAEVDELFDSMSDADREALLEHSFNRYYETSGLFGSPESCLVQIQRLKGLGVDEIACLIDFGVAQETVLACLPHLSRLHKLANQGTDSSAPDIAELMEQHRVTHLQCVPSMASMLVGDDSTRAHLEKLELLLVGGEALPTDLGHVLAETVSGTVQNM